MKVRNSRKRAFSIIEMLVVIGIIAVLMGLLFPSLGAVQKRSRKLVELNQIRQVGMAWTMYGNSNDDAALPGYLDWEGEPSVQDAWRVRYEYPVPRDSANPTDKDIPQEIAAPWTWRLAQYLDYSPDILWGYRRDAMTDIFSLVSPEYDDADGSTPQRERPWRVAHQPGFAYNGYYVGGWWEMQEIGEDEVVVRPQVRFADVRRTDTNQRVSVVTRSVSAITRPTELVLFCSATLHEGPGMYSAVADDIYGSHIVVPPYLGSEAMWHIPRPGAVSGNTVGVSTGGDPYTLETLQRDVPAPAARHNNFVAVLHADGSTDTPTVSTLAPLTNWIDRATARTFRHTDD